MLPSSRASEASPSDRWSLPVGSDNGVPSTKPGAVRASAAARHGRAPTFVLGGLLPPLGPVGGHALRYRLPSACDISRRFVAGLASDLLSAAGAAFAGGDARRALERAAGAGAPRICSTSLDAFDLGLRRSISLCRSAIACAMALMAMAISLRCARLSTTVRHVCPLPAGGTRYERQRRGGDDAWRPRVRRGRTRQVPGPAGDAVDLRAWPAWSGSPAPTDCRGLRARLTRWTGRPPASAAGTGRTRRSSFVVARTCRPAPA